MPRVTPTTTCTHHCSQCGRCFHSLESFDLHHEHDESGWPVCLDPLDLRDRDGLERLVTSTTAGECRVYATVNRSATIWTTARSAEIMARWQQPERLMSTACGPALTDPTDPPAKSRTRQNIQLSSGDVEPGQVSRRAA